MTAYYEILFGLSIVLTLIYLAIWHKHFDVHITLIFAFIPIANLGYAILAHSRNLDTALAAIKVTYIGGCFLALFICQSIFSLCHINLKRWMSAGLTILSMISFSFVLSIGNSPYFYKTVSFEMHDGVGVLVKEYGFLHTIFYVMVAVYFVISLSTLVYSFTKKKDVSNQVVILMAVPEVIAIIAYFGARLFPHNVEPLPVAYNFAQLFFLFIVKDMCLYDVSETHLDSINETGNSGFISFDFKDRYLGSNVAARKFFPELAEVKVGTPAEESPFLKEQALNRLQGFRENEENDTSFYSRNGHTYIFDVDYLYDGKKKRGLRIFVTDDTKNQEYIALINRFNTTLKEEVDEKTAHIAEMHDKLILSMATLVESRDNSTGGHIKRTSQGVRILVDEMMKRNKLHLTQEFRRAIIKAAPMHDLGKIAVDDAILRKPGRFEPWEYEQMKKHAAEGGRVIHQILEGTDDEYFRKIAENVANYHHERWDGSGYPEGLSGLAIPLEARIMAIADVYDALVSKRGYKESMSFEEADRIIMEGMGKHFDPPEAGGVLQKSGGMTPGTGLRPRIMPP